MIYHTRPRVLHSRRTQEAFSLSLLSPFLGLRVSSGCTCARKFNLLPNRSKPHPQTTVPPTSRFNLSSRKHEDSSRGSVRSGARDRGRLAAGRFRGERRRQGSSIHRSHQQVRSLSLRLSGCVLMSVGCRSHPPSCFLFFRMHVLAAQKKIEVASLEVVAAGVIAACLHTHMHKRRKEDTRQVTCWDSNLTYSR